MNKNDFKDQVRLQQAHQKISESGCLAEDDDLFKKPDFFEEIHELEHHKSCHSPPAVINSGENSKNGQDATSSCNCARASINTTLQSFIFKPEEQNEMMIADLPTLAEQKKQLPSAINSLVYNL